VAFSALHPTAGRIDATLPDLGCGMTWNAVHRAKPRPDLRCTDCRHGLHAKVSPKGLRHFAHNPGRPDDCLWLNESLEHHFLKLELATAIRAAGWHAELEVRAADGAWRADVLASRHDGSRRMAWEAQLSPIADDDLRGRTARYRAEGIEVCWVSPNSRVPWIGVEPSVRVVEPRGDAPWMVVDGVARFDVRDGSWFNVDHLGLARFVQLVLDGQTLTHLVMPRYRRIKASDGALHAERRVVWTAANYVADELGHDAMRRRQEEEKRRREAEAQAWAEAERLAEIQRQQEAEARRLEEQQQREAAVEAERVRLEEAARLRAIEQKREHEAWLQRMEEERLERERKAEEAERERIRRDEAELAAARAWWAELSQAQIEELKNAIVEPLWKREGTRMTFDERGGVDSAGFGVPVDLRGRWHGVMRPSPASADRLRYGETVYVRNAREAELITAAAPDKAFKITHFDLPDHEQESLF
jgi:hypothetical protein